MTESGREAYETAKSLYDDYGRAYSAGHRAGDVLGGSLKIAADSIGVFMEGMSQTRSEENKQAQWEIP